MIVFLNREACVGSFQNFGIELNAPVCGTHSCKSLCLLFNLQLVFKLQIHFNLNTISFAYSNDGEGFKYRQIIGRD